MTDQPPPPPCTGLTAVWCPNCGSCSCPPASDGTPSYCDPACRLHAPSAPHAEPPSWLKELGHRLRTQDNRATAHPVFVVQQRERIVGVDDGYTDNYVWMDEEWDEQDPPEDEDNPPEGWTRVGYLDQWVFVTACFTEQGCRDYLALNGHNLREPRIYVESAYRNQEWQRLRALLLQLGEEPTERAEP